MGMRATTCISGNSARVIVMPYPFDLSATATIFLAAIRTIMPTMATAATMVMTVIMNHLH